MIIENEDVYCCLICGKSRVAAVKYVSIPRIEFTASTLSVKVSDMLKIEFDIPVVWEEFWEDSQVLLGYISNEAGQFKPLLPIVSVY